VFVAFLAWHHYLVKASLRAIPVSEQHATAEILATLNQTTLPRQDERDAHDPATRAVSGPQKAPPPMPTATAAIVPASANLKEPPTHASPPNTTSDREKFVADAMRELTESGVVPTLPAVKGRHGSASSPAALPVKTPAVKPRVPIGDRIPGEETAPSTPPDPLAQAAVYARAHSKDDTPYRIRGLKVLDALPAVYLEPIRGAFEAPGRWLTVGDAFADGWSVTSITQSEVRLLSPGGHIVVAAQSDAKPATR
jgi:hypothetical protein